MTSPPPTSDRSSSRGEKKRPSSSRRSVSETENGKPAVGEHLGITVAEFKQQQQQQQDKESNRKGNKRRQQNHKQLTQGGEEGESHKNRDNAQHQQHSVVDAIPADHPSSSIIQTLRTCTLCHRTLPRAQFCERDRYTIHDSLAAGAVCRTCSMTISAVRLKGIPDTEQLLMAYAERGEQLAFMIEGIRDKAGHSSLVGYHHGEETPPNYFSYNGNPVVTIASSSNRTDSTMGMPTQPFSDVNGAFLGHQYGGGEEDRPANVADCKYIDALLSYPSYLNLNAFGVFQSSEDISISMASLEAVRLYGTMEQAHFIPHDTEGMSVKRFDDDDEGMDTKSVVCLVLGEGRTPSTAILAAQHFGWTSYSIDPSLSEGWEGCHDDIAGFTGYSGTIDDFVANTADSTIEIQNQSVSHLVIIMIQKQKDQLRLTGVANIMEIRSLFNDVPTTLVSISPVRKATLAPKRRAGQHMSILEKDIGYEPNCCYIDSGVFSACRLMEVWNFHNADDDEETSGSESYHDEHSELRVEQQEQQIHDDQNSDRPSQGRNESIESEFLEFLKRKKDNNEHTHCKEDHAIDSEGTDYDDDDVWGKALAKHNEQEQKKFVEKFEDLYVNDASTIEKEELERTKSEASKNEQNLKQTADYDFSSRQENSRNAEGIHEDMIAWSDDEPNWSDDEVADLPKGISGSPRKSQPWHKKDSSSNNSIGSFD